MTKIRKLLNVERAISDLRRGYAVHVTQAKSKRSLVVLAADTAAEKTLRSFAKALGNGPKLLLSGKRVQALFPGKKTDGKPKIFPLPKTLDMQALYLYSGLDTSKLPSLKPTHMESAQALEISALELVKHAELLPAALIMEVKGNPKQWALEHDVLTVNSAAIAAFKSANAGSLKEVCTAPLCLEGAEDASIRVYRPSLGGSEHYAIIIGKALNDKAPLVRIHSSCYTGDLLRSLRCDCGDQLHEAIHFMGEKAMKAKLGDSGGIIIYLMQEGRGIGLTNKLRAYDLQARGMDTVDANEVLGFDDDERLFLPAVTILKSLGVNSIRLLTNNPKKAKGLKEHGIHVVKCVPHIMRAHKHNKAYLQTKASRLGHNLPTR